MPDPGCFAFVHASRPLCFAHRGGSALWPENTLLSFQGALELGCDALELDLRETRDGQLVVFHDARLERTTNGRGLLSDLTLRELKQLDAGYRFSPDNVYFPYRGQGVAIPTLEEVIELDTQIRLNVEIKPEQPDLAEKLWHFIERYGLHDRMLVASHQDPLLRAFRHISSGRVATSASFREALTFWSATCLGLAGGLTPQYCALQVPPRYRGLTVVSRRLIRVAHSIGLHVHVWTIDEPPEMHRLLELGVDGLMSDRPDLLLCVLRDWHS
jgi:glycerophosphoryl diester phosphodiesterase